MIKAIMIVGIPFAVLISLFRLWLLIATWEVKRILAHPREERWVQHTRISDPLNQAIFFALALFLIVVLEALWVW